MPNSMSKEVHNLQEVEDSDFEESEDDSSLFAYSVGTSCVPKEEQFYEVVKVKDTRIRFQLDSGAIASVMSLKNYSNLKREQLPPLKKDKHCIDFHFQAQAKTSGRSSIDHKIQRQGRRCQICCSGA